jgi:hypothetical protein
MNVSTPCGAARASLSKLRSFVATAQAHVRADTPAEVLERDQAFLHTAEEALQRCNQESLRSLLEEMRGLRHYFGSYCSDLSRLDDLIEELFATVQESANHLCARTTRPDVQWKP